MRSSHLLWLPTCFLALAAFACGSSQPQAEAPDPVAAEPDADTADLAADAAIDEETPADDRGSNEGDEAAEDSSKPSSRSDAIQKVVKDNRQKVRDCYEAALKETPDLKGDMVIHFEVDAEGKVSAANLVAERSQISTPKVVDCAIAALKAMPFPPHPDGMDTKVNYPFNFNP